MPTPGAVEQTSTRPQHRKPHDPSVSFEEYRYYAKITRAEEDANSKADLGDTTFISFILPPKNIKGDVVQTSPPGSREKMIQETSSGKSSVERNVHDMDAADRSGVSDDEWTNASRAMRTATWAAVFYLIITDILGPFNVPYVT